MLPEASQSMVEFSLQKLSKYLYKLFVGKESYVNEL